MLSPQSVRRYADYEHFLVNDSLSSAAADLIPHIAMYFNNKNQLLQINHYNTFRTITMKERYDYLPNGDVRSVERFGAAGQRFSSTRTVPDAEAVHFLEILWEGTIDPSQLQIRFDEQYDSLGVRDYRIYFTASGERLGECFYFYKDGLLIGEIWRDGKDQTVREIDYRYENGHRYERIRKVWEGDNIR